MIKFKLSVEVFKGLMECVADKFELRRYLQGVGLFQYKGNWFAAATNGHYLLVHKMLELEGTSPEGDPFIISPDALVWVKGLKKGVVEIQINEDKSAVLVCGGQQFNQAQCWSVGNGRFPDVMRVFNSYKGQMSRGQFQSAHVRFNPNYLVKLEKVVKLILGSRKAGHNLNTFAGDCAGYDVIDINTVFLVMPMRDTTEFQPLPDWVTD